MELGWFHSPLPGDPHCAVTSQPFLPGHSGTGRVMGGSSQPCLAAAHNKAAPWNYVRCRRIPQSALLKPAVCRALQWMNTFPWLVLGTQDRQKLLQSIGAELQFPSHSVNSFHLLCLPAFIPSPPPGFCLSAATKDGAPGPPPCSPSAEGLWRLAEGSAGGHCQQHFSALHLAASHGFHLALSPQTSLACPSVLSKTAGWKSLSPLPRFIS